MSRLSFTKSSVLMSLHDNNSHYKEPNISLRPYNDIVKEV